VLVGIGVSVAAGAGVKVGLGVLVGVGTGVGALAINEVSGHPRHPNALPKTDTAINITNRDLFIVYYFHSPLKQSGQCRALRILCLEFQLLVLYHTLREIQRLGEVLFFLLLAQNTIPFTSLP
jgi:hypothetical protein